MTWKDPLTLDERIKLDLNTLYDNGLIELIEKFKKCRIEAADELSKKLFGKKGELSAHGLPGYFTGDRNAKTVMVMLNPGQDVVGKDNPVTTIETLSKLGITTNSVEEFIESYRKGNTAFGKHDRSNREEKDIYPDSFDLKQAAFFKEWPSDPKNPNFCGIRIHKDFPNCINWDKKNSDENKLQRKQEIELDVVEEVLMKKLQLELVPYASRDFKQIPQKNLENLFPFVETLFDEIFSNVSENDSRYVIFCADVFDKLFKKFVKKHPGRVEYEKDNPQKSSYEIFKQEEGKTPKPANCTPIRIYQYDNKKGYSLKAIIAHTFPIQSLSTAYNRMVEYGKFCWEKYSESQL